MLVFARVVQAGSFTAAAAELGMPKSTVSRKVAELEERLKARLLQRTTRKFSLTDAGRTYYDYCARIVGEVEDAERAITRLQETPRGLLRVTAPVNSAFLGPVISDYLKRYPEVRIELFCTGRLVDLVEERFDVGIRAGALADSTLVARRLGTARWFLVATPGYLKKRGRPRSPEDLRSHDCLFFGAGANATMHLENGPASVTISPGARTLVNDMDILDSVVIAGLGIGLVPAVRCAEALREGRLERVLADWDAPATPVHVVYPSSRHVSPKVKSFVDHLQQRVSSLLWSFESPESAD